MRALSVPVQNVWLGRSMKQIVCASTGTNLDVSAYYYGPHLSRMTKHTPTQTPAHPHRDICKIVAEQQRAIPCSSADAETISSSSGATPTPSKRVYIQLSAKHDAYVPLDSGLTLAKAMKSAPGTVASELRILPGGHASALVLHRGAVVKAVVDAVCLLDKQRRDQEGRAETDSDGELEAVM